MPLQATSGAASYDGFGGGVAAVPNYIEDVFSTYLYRGNGSTQTITNGIDLATKGGLVWAKMRSNGSTTGHVLSDTARGPSQKLDTSSTGASSNWTPYGISAFGSTGFTVADDGAGNYVTNNSGVNYVSWTFRKQPKFFDVVTYTGDGTAGRQIAHSLNSAPGAIIVKNTNVARDWAVWHRSLADGTYLKLNTTDAAITNTSFQVFGDASGQTSTYFTVGKTGSGVNGLTNANASGETYVAYLFAHNAGGFGLTGTDNVISCGSLVSTGGVVNVNLGYETQWLLIKNASNIDSWYMYDTMRGMSVTDDYFLKANSSNAESNFGASYVKPTATGFSFDSSAFGASGETYIYIAIRRGPMKVPTSGTSVFNTNLETASTNPQTLTTGFPVDLSINTLKNVNSTIRYVLDRLRGSSVSSGVFLQTNGTNAETATSGLGFQNNTGLDDNGWWNTNGATFWSFRRAPSFFDVVCYTGDGTADSRTFTHNLGVTPQLVMVKRRSSTSDWVVTFNTSHAVLLNSTNADIGYNDATGNYANGILVGTNATTLTQYSGASGNSACNASGSTYVAYLFATCAGVSKVGSYVGDDTVGRVINCGFTSGARFVMLKKTSTTSDWYVYDTARGIVSAGESSLSLNTTAAESGSSDVIDPDSTGFAVGTGASNFFNETGVTYIYLAIA